MRTTACLKAIMEVYGKTITGLGPVLVDREFSFLNVYKDINGSAGIAESIQLCI